MIRFEDYLAEHDAEMTAANVLELVNLPTSNGIGLHVDGGWAVNVISGRSQPVSRERYSL